MQEALLAQKTDEPVVVEEAKKPRKVVRKESEGSFDYVPLEEGTPRLTRNQLALLKHEKHKRLGWGFAAPGIVLGALTIAYIVFIRLAKDWGWWDAPYDAMKSWDFTHPDPAEQHADITAGMMGAAATLLMGLVSGIANGILWYKHKAKIESQASDEEIVADMLGIDLEPDSTPHEQAMREHLAANHALREIYLDQLLAKIKQLLSNYYLGAIAARETRGGKLPASASRDTYRNSIFYSPETAMPAELDNLFETILHQDAGESASAPAQQGRKNLFTEDIEKESLRGQFDTELRAIVNEVKAEAARLVTEYKAGRDEQIKWEGPDSVATKITDFERRIKALKEASASCTSVARPIDPEPEEKPRHHAYDRLA